MQAQSNTVAQIVCNIKRKQKPILLNVKGEGTMSLHGCLVAPGYQIHTKLVEESEGRELRSSLKAHDIKRFRFLSESAWREEILDFGEVHTEEKRSFTLKLSSPSKSNRFDDDILPARAFEGVIKQHVSYRALKLSLNTYRPMDFNFHS